MAKVKLTRKNFKARRMKSIKEQANEYADNHGFRVPYDGSDNFYDDVDVKASKEGFMAGANYVLDIVEKELQRRMLEDYNQGVEEDEIAQGCMATMIMFVRQLKK